jgi:hypothetical protein
VIQALRSISASERSRARPTSLLRGRRAAPAHRRSLAAIVGIGALVLCSCGTTPKTAKSAPGPTSAAAPTTTVENTTLPVAVTSNPTAATGAPLPRFTVWFRPPLWTNLVYQDAQMLKSLAAEVKAQSDALQGDALLQTDAVSAFRAAVPPGTPGGSGVVQGLALLARATDDFLAYGQAIDSDLNYANSQALQCSQDVQAGETTLRQALIDGGIPQDSLPVSPTSAG